MQPHSAFHRHTFSIPNPSRRFTSSSPRQPTRPTPFSKILLSALAVTAGKTIVLDGQTGYGGGAGWLTLAFWAGRIVSEARNEWKQRSEGKGKERERDGTQLGPTHIALALVLAAQSMLFMLGVNAVGPLRSTLLVTLGVLLSKTASRTWSSITKMIPLGVACLTILWHLALHNSVLATLPLVLLSGTTTLLHGRLSGAVKGSSGERRSPLTFSIVTLAGAMSAAGVMGLWTIGLIPTPFPIPQASNTHFLSVLTAIVAFWLPLPWPSPLASKSAFRFRTTRDHVLLFASIFAFQAFAFRPQPTQLDALVIAPLALITFALHEPPLEPLKAEHQGWSYPAPVSTSRSWSIIQLLPPAWRPHIQTIVNTPSSSKIFYFLLLNLAYMGVQMAYGVLTNSLGLISDAIHMAFDCLGLAVGLWASVASTWKPDQQYTFGYGRVETLSGFANGCFLILISVFIIFEAIQRVMNPPELMAIDRLLWVSSVGLAINLFGMYATGGHHHHGHGHGHGHDHGHGHSHIAVNEKKVDHRHDDHHKPAISRKGSQGISHSVHASPPRVRKRSSQLALKTKFHESSSIQNGANHGHSHSHAEPHDEHHGHSHDEHSHADEHDHQHCDHGHGETHSHDHDHDHDHSHSHDHSHGHDHAHSHNMRGVFLHVLADTLGSVGVIVSTILIKWTGWSGFDPLASIFIALLIVASVVPLVIDSGRILCLDVGEGKEKEIREALAELSSVEGLSNYGSPRFWPRCEGELVGSIHIHLAPSASAYDPSKPSSQPDRKHGQTIYANASKVVGRVERVLKGKISGLSELVIQVEGSEDKPFCSCTTGR